MNKSSLIFKITTITMLCLDALFLLFFGVSFLTILAKRNIFQSYHLIVFLTFVAINFAYIVYLTIMLILNRNIKIKTENKAE